MALSEMALDSYQRNKLHYPALCPIPCKHSLPIELISQMRNPLRNTADNQPQELCCHQHRAIKCYKGPAIFGYYGALASAFARDFKKQLQIPIHTSSTQAPAKFSL